MLPIANHWYDTKKVSDDLTLIFEPHVHPFLRCNIWHLKGRDRDLLIDTGLGVSSLKDAIASTLDKPVIALATHIHFDHVGCLHEFDHRYMHHIEAPRMQLFDEFYWLKVTDFPEAFHDDLRTDEYQDYLIKARPSAEFDVDSYRVISTSITRSLKEGDVIDLGNKALEVFHLPGHSPGSIGLWDKFSQTLFSGDALYDGELLDELPDSNIPDYLDTMKRLRGLSVDVVHGGHEASFGRARMVELIDEYVGWRTRDR